MYIFIPRAQYSIWISNPDNAKDVFLSQMFPFTLCLWGIKFTDHFPSVVHGVKFLMKQVPAVCHGWRLVCWKKGSWYLRSPAFQHTALALASDRREFRARTDPFKSARSCFALEMHYFALHFLLSLRIFCRTYRV